MTARDDGTSGEAARMDEEAPRRRRPMSRIGELMPQTAARLGLEDELRKARFIATFDAIVAERAPAASPSAVAPGRATAVTSVARCSTLGSSRT